MSQARASRTVTSRRRTAVRETGCLLGLTAAGFLCLSAGSAVAGAAGGNPQAPAVQTAAADTAPSIDAPQVRAMLNRYCVGCHSDRGAAAGSVPISLQGIDAADVAAHAADWEMVALKLRARMMPPVGRPRPDEATYDGVADWLEAELDRAAGDDLNPGRTTVHRLNRLEYGNAVRDLLGLEIDPEALLPPDDEDEGFDNIADVLSVSPTLMERYLYAARQVSQLAIGDAGLRARFDTYRVPDREIQDEHNSDDLPFGTRGGIAVRHYFPLDGEYSIRVGLRRNFYNYIRGIGNTSRPGPSVRSPDSRHWRLAPRP